MPTHSALFCLQAAWYSFIHFDQQQKALIHLPLDKSVAVFPVWFLIYIIIYAFLCDMRE